ncbi:MULTISPECIES: hypothetical protein [unclassified Fusibacter]|uniref:hypothetical protein n=1 Tax=unclassified Fusibacter TaxID=2624464 RepID=UPI0010130986|nr:MULTISPECIES: hypothetical protein [unclassified Fusibacter]MCK8059170.1 hypothetical protein [Fusibacter sp. A2]NPE22579.1 hypothetical protein [Fusibacter sp. A1]RXV60680.1 hypothetical protein DWB64_12080 [Fusibacter sp. A1]
MKHINFIIALLLLPILTLSCFAIGGIQVPDDMDLEELTSIEEESVPLAIPDFVIFNNLNASHLGGLMVPDDLWGGALSKGQMIDIEPSRPPLSALNLDLPGSELIKLVNLGHLGGVQVLTDMWDSEDYLDEVNKNHLGGFQIEE